METSVPHSLIETIDKESLFCLLGHADPDGDCIGSQLALAHFLRRLGKTAHLYSPGPFGRPEIKEFEPQFRSRIEASVLGRDPVAIVLDCSSIDRVGPLAEDLRDLATIAVIDHHTAGNPFGNLHYIDPSVPAVALLVQYLIEAMGHTVERSEAKWLLFGFCTDTGFFRHLDAKAEDTFDALGRLNAAGATPKQIYGMIYGGRPLGARLLLGRLLARTESLLDERLLLTYETLEDKQTFGAANRDSDSLYQQLQTVVGCKAVVFIREEDDRSCTVGLRSNEEIDVGAIAKSFGGGGHKRAAGFTWEGSRAEIKRRIVSAFASALD